MKQRLWLVGLLFTAASLAVIAVNLSLAMMHGVEIRLPTEQQAVLDRAAEGPQDVSRELSAVRQALQGTDGRAAAIQASIDRLSNLLEEPLSKAENLRVDDAENQLRELQSGLRDISAQLRGLRSDLAVFRPLGSNR